MQARRIGVALAILLAATAAGPTTMLILRPGVAPPGDSLMGEWRSSLPARRQTLVGAIDDSTVMVVAPGTFEARCTIEDGDLVGIAWFSARVDPAFAAWARVQLLRAAWTDPTTLHVKWMSPTTGGIRAEETWHYVASLQAPPERAPIAGADSLPRFGDYVFVEDLPEVIERVAPDYPTWAREKGVEGTVMVQALVGKDGRVKDTMVVKSIPMLDDYAIAAVKQWRFKPARTKGEPVAVWVGVPVKFSLH